MALICTRFVLHFIVLISWNLYHWLLEMWCIYPRPLGLFRWYWCNHLTVLMCQWHHPGKRHGQNRPVSNRQKAQGSNFGHYQWNVLKPIHFFFAPRVLCNIGYPSKTHRKLISRAISFVHIFHFDCPFALQFCTEHGSYTAVLCAKFQNNLFCSYFDSHNVINVKFCTWHHSCAPGVFH